MTDVSTMSTAMVTTSAVTLHRWRWCRVRVPLGPEVTHRHAVGRVLRTRVRGDRAGGRLGDVPRCHKAHPTMNAMGQNLPTHDRAIPRVVRARILKLVPDYMEG